MASNKPPSPTRNKGGSGPSSGQPSGFRFPGWIVWVIFAGLLVWNVATFFGPHQTSTLTLNYSDFITQVQAGNVQQVTISGQEVRGDLKKAITQSVATPVTSTVPLPAATTTTTTTSTQFTTVLPMLNDPTLIPLLESKGVGIEAVDPQNGQWLVTLLSNALPILLLVGLMLYMGRQMRQGQQSAMGFGRSRARLYNAERPPITFADVAGEDEAKAELAEVVDFLKDPARYHKVGARLPRGVLLIGPPGTGKTLLARAVAGEAGVPFFSISASEFVELFVGVGASRVRDLFEQARTNAPSIVFVDEIDAVGRQRGAGLGGGNDEREQTLNQLLVAMDGFDEGHEVIIIAATNRPDVLDPALLRPGRFDRQVTVGLPDRNGRVQILKVHAKNKPIGSDVDYELLARATPGFSGADLANLMNEAALVAAHDNHLEIHRKDFERALDKIVLGLERPALHSEDERRVVAYHEAGHALVAVLTPGADPVNKVTIIPRGRSLGVTEQLPTDDRLNYPRSYLEGRLAVLLGGRSAEEIIFKESTTGAENDLQQATKIARRMVGSWGMAEGLAPVYYNDDSGDVFLGRDIIQTRTFSDQTVARLDQAVAGLVDRAHQQALQAITEHRGELDGIVARLLEYETITGDDIRRIVGDDAQPASTHAMVPNPGLLAEPQPNGREATPANDVDTPPFRAAS